MLCITCELLTAPYYCSYFSIAAVPPEFPLPCPYTLHLCVTYSSFSLNCLPQVSVKGLLGCMKVGDTESACTCDKMNEVTVKYSANI